MRAKGGLSFILIASAAAQAAPECKQFQEIYASGKELCENMWGEAFKYETDEDKAYTMWFFEAMNPNTNVSAGLFGAGNAEPDVCHLDYLHKDAPGPEPEGFEECLPWKENACCHKDTVSTAQQLKEAYGEEYHWDRCGPLSPACDRFFVMEACFYECEPAAGLFRRYPKSLMHDRAGHIEYDASCDEYHADYDATKDCAHNEWELYRMPIKASFCDAWYTACKHDKFCAADDGNFFTCAEKYEAVDDAGRLRLAAGLGGGAAALLLLALGCVAYIVRMERKGKPIFKPLNENANGEAKSTEAAVADVHQL